MRMTKTRTELRKAIAGVVERLKARGWDDLTAEQACTLSNDEYQQFEALLDEGESLQKELFMLGDGPLTQRGGPVVCGPDGRLFGVATRPYQRIEAGQARSFAQLFGPPAPAAWESPGEFYRTLGSGLFDPRLQAAMAEGSPSQGGFLVPEETVARVLDTPLHGGSIVLSRATIEPMLYRTKHVAGFDALSQSSPGTGIYGFSTEWLPENGQGTLATPQTREIQLTARVLAAYFQASNELAEDASDFDALITGRGAVALSEALDFAFLRGSGAGQPLGILTSPALLTQAKESGQVADTIVYENVVGMWAKSSNPAGSVWICNPSCVPQLLKVVVVVKNVAGTENVGGGHVPLVTVMADGSMAMMGRPLLPSSKLPVLGEANDLIFCDLSAYVVGLRKDMTLARSEHVGFQSNRMTWRLLMRVDGQPLVGKAYTGGDSQSYSPYVGLAERA